MMVWKLRLTMWFLLFLHSRGFRQVQNEEDEEPYRVAKDFGIFEMVESSDLIADARLGNENPTAWDSRMYSENMFHRVIPPHSFFYEYFHVLSPWYMCVCIYIYSFFPISIVFLFCTTYIYIYIIRIHICYCMYVNIISIDMHLSDKAPQNPCAIRGREPRQQHQEIPGEQTHPLLRRTTDIYIYNIYIYV